MEQQNLISIYNSCRLCLQQQGKYMVFEIHNLSEDIYTWMNVKMEPEDGLPQSICEQCFEIINSVRMLRDLALRNESQLRVFTLNNETKEKVQIPASIGLTVRKDLFPSDVVANKPELPNEPSENSIDEKPFHMDDAPKQKHVRVEIAEFHKCTICDKVYESKKKWYLHQRTHNKSFYCPVPLCNKKFANKSDMDKHVRVHTGVKPYECEICFKKFTQKCSLKIHKENLHNNEEI